MGFFLHFFDDLVLFFFGFRFGFRLANFAAVVTVVEMVVEGETVMVVTLVAVVVVGLVVAVVVVGAVALVVVVGVVMAAGALESSVV